MYGEFACWAWSPARWLIASAGLPVSRVEEPLARQRRAVELAERDRLRPPGHQTGGCPVGRGELEAIEVERRRDDAADERPRAERSGGLPRAGRDDDLRAVARDDVRRRVGGPRPPARLPPRPRPRGARRPRTARPRRRPPDASASARRPRGGRRSRCSTGRAPSIGRRAPGLGEPAALGMGTQSQGGDHGRGIGHASRVSQPAPVPGRVVVPYGHVPKHQDPPSCRDRSHDRRTGGRRPPVRPQDQRLPRALRPQSRGVRSRHRGDRVVVAARCSITWASPSRKARTAGRRRPRVVRLTAPWWSRPGLDARDGRLTIAGEDAEALARAHGTPLFVYDRARYVENARRFQAALAGAGLRLPPSVRAQGQPDARDPRGRPRSRRARDPGERRHRRLLARRGHPRARVRLAAGRDQLHRHERLRARPRRPARRTRST